MGFELLNTPSQASSLTPELWAEVFAHLAFDTEKVTLQEDDGNLDLELKQEQLQLHQLKLVCKQFRDIFATHSGLVQRVYVCPDFPLRSLCSLLTWLHQNKGSVQELQSADRRTLDAVLAGLVTSEQRLKVIDITGSSACSIPLVAALTRLEKCAITHKDIHSLDLTPLGVLSRLTALRLTGRFHQLHHLAGLSQLICFNATVLEAHAFAPMLQHLEIVDSTLSGVHSHGLSPCTALTQLVLNNAHLEDSDNNAYLDRALCLTPASIGLLTQLHRLDLSTYHYAEDFANLEWVMELTSLQDLSMSFCMCSPINVVQHVSVLTKLTRLIVLGQPDSVSEELPGADINIEWFRLQAMQELSICQVRLKLGQGVAGLLQLHCLKQISFAGSTFLTEKDRGYFDALMHILAELRPQVKLVHDL